MNWASMKRYETDEQQAAPLDRRRTETTATDRQLAAIRSLAGQLSLTPGEVLAGSAYSRFEEISRRFASTLIERLTSEATGSDERGAASGSSFTVVNGRVEHREAPKGLRINGMEI